MFALWLVDGKIDTLEGAAFEDKWRTDYENTDIAAPNFSDLNFSSEMKVNPMNTIYPKSHEEED